MKRINLCKMGHQPQRVAYVWEKINRVFRVCSVCDTEIWEVYQPEREGETNAVLNALTDPYQRNGEGGFRDGTEVVLVLVLLVLFLPTVMAWQAALAQRFPGVGGG